MALVSDAEFLAHMPTGTTSAEALTRMSAALAGAHRAIYKHCGRTFSTVATDTTATARTFRPDRARQKRLSIHDCIEITSVVENGSTLTAGTHYIAEPLNGLDELGLTVPYEGLSRYCAHWYHDDVLPTVTVTAKWGYATEANGPPPGAVEACKLLAQDILGARDLTGDVAGFSEFGAVRIRQNPTVAYLLHPLRRFEAIAVMA